MGIFLTIIGLIAAGCLVAHIIMLTIKWIRDKIAKKLAAKNVKKVAVMDIEKLVAECENKMSMDELNKVVDEGYTHVMSDIDANGNVVGDVEVIKDTSETLDSEVEQLLGRERIVVVS